MTQNLSQKNLKNGAYSVCFIAYSPVSLLKTLLGSVEKWEGSDKNFQNWPKIKWPTYIINH